jgi:hypothetical protein
MKAPAAKLPSRPLQAAPIARPARRSARERGRLDSEVAEDAENQADVQGDEMIEPDTWSASVEMVAVHHPLASGRSRD